MSWPSSQDYNEAVQSPQISFADPDLKGGEAATNALGLPMPRSGNFADVYEFQTPSGRWAVKCFTRETRNLCERYRVISEHLSRAKLPFLVDFQFQEQGIRIRGVWRPIVKMQWVDGQLLNEFVRTNLDKPAVLDGLLSIWRRMAARLKESGIAHGDLQHGNVILVPGERTNTLAVKLIDYDGMWVPGLQSMPPGELGHLSYQHPTRVRERHYDADLDRFPLLLIAAALRGACVGGKELWRKYDNGDNLLFREGDLVKPAESPLLRELMSASDPTTASLAQLVRKSLTLPPAQTPWLDAPSAKEIAPARRAISAKSPARSGSARAPAPRVRWIMYGGCAAIALLVAVTAWRSRRPGEDEVRTPEPQAIAQAPVASQPDPVTPAPPPTLVPPPPAPMLTPAAPLPKLEPPTAPTPMPPPMPPPVLSTVTLLPIPEVKIEVGKSTSFRVEFVRTGPPVSIFAGLRALPEYVISSPIGVLPGENACLVTVSANAMGAPRWTETIPATFVASYGAGMTAEIPFHFTLTPSEATRDPALQSVAISVAPGNTKSTMVRFSQAQEAVAFVTTARRNDQVKVSVRDDANILVPINVLGKFSASASSYRIDIHNNGPDPVIGTLVHTIPIAAVAKKPNPGRPLVVPAYPIKTVMQMGMGSRGQGGSLANKVVSGKASESEKAKLVELFAALDANRPRRGDAASWSAKTEEILSAAKAGNTIALKNALNCKACHDAHK